MKLTRSMHDDIVVSEAIASFEEPK